MFLIIKQTKNGNALKYMEEKLLTENGGKYEFCRNSSSKRERIERNHSILYLIRNAFDLNNSCTRQMLKRKAETT